MVNEQHSDICGLLVQVGEQYEGLRQWQSVSLVMCGKCMLWWFHLWIESLDLKHIEERTVWSWRRDVRLELMVGEGPTMLEFSEAES